MTTFTSEDRQEAYQKKVEDAPYHPGYEDAVVTPRSDPVYRGMDPAKMIWRSKPLNEDEIFNLLGRTNTTRELIRAVEQAHGIK